MYKWLKTAEQSNIPINCNIFKEKALEFSKSSEFHNFQACDEWLCRQKKRFNVSFKTASGNQMYLWSLISCCFKMFIKLFSAEKYNSQGIFISFLSPRLMAFPVISREQVFALQARRKYKMIFADLPVFSLVSCPTKQSFFMIATAICPLYFWLKNCF